MLLFRIHTRAASRWQFAKIAPQPAQSPLIAQRSDRIWGRVDHGCDGGEFFEGGEAGCAKGC